MPYRKIMASKRKAANEPTEVLAKEQAASQSDRLLESEESCISRWNELDDDGLDKEIKLYR